MGIENIEALKPHDKSSTIQSIQPNGDDVVTVEVPMPTKPGWYAYSGGGAGDDLPAT